VTFFVKGKNSMGIGGNVLHGSYALQHGWQLDTIKILGTKYMPTKIRINGNLVPPKVKAIFPPTNALLEIHGLYLPMGKSLCKRLHNMYNIKV